eukprot:evm.model.scf_1295.3 EVM.evm.TU.scf_1295.3   scf_1295:16222-20710(+)
MPKRFREVAEEGGAASCSCVYLDTNTRVRVPPRRHRNLREIYQKLGLIHRRLYSDDLGSSAEPGDLAETWRGCVTGSRLADTLNVDTFVEGCLSNGFPAEQDGKEMLQRLRQSLLGQIEELEVGRRICRTRKSEIMKDMDADPHEIEGLLSSIRCGHNRSFSTPPASLVDSLSCVDMGQLTGCTLTDLGDCVAGRDTIQTLKAGIRAVYNVVTTMSDCLNSKRWSVGIPAAQRCVRKLQEFALKRRASKQQSAMESAAVLIQSAWRGACVRHWFLPYRWKANTMATKIQRAWRTRGSSQAASTEPHVVCTHKCTCPEPSAVGDAQDHGVLGQYSEALKPVWTAMGRANSVPAGGRRKSGSLWSIVRQWPGFTEPEPSMGTCPESGVVSDIEEGIAGQVEIGRSQPNNKEDSKVWKQLKEVAVDGVSDDHVSLPRDTNMPHCGCAKDADNLCN